MKGRRVPGTWILRPGTGFQARDRRPFPAPGSEFWFRGPCTGIPGPWAYPDIPESLRQPLYAEPIAANDPEYRENFWIAMGRPNFLANLIRIMLFYFAIGSGARDIP